MPRANRHYNKRARALFSHAAMDSGYTTVEAAVYLEKEPASVAEYEKRCSELAGEMKRLRGKLDEKSKTL